jgi:hypothetical protein
VDARLHQLQGKAEYVTSSPNTTSREAALPVLLEFYREKLGEMLEHQEHAQSVGQYDANNTYQYIINREDVQLSWLAAAIADAGGTLPDEPAPPVSDLSKAGKGADLARAIFDADRRDAQAFLDRWRPRVETMTNARHRGMLRVILGETREQQRFFEQALEGRTDLLGRRAGVDGQAFGKVLPARWIE